MMMTNTCMCKRVRVDERECEHDMHFRAWVCVTIACKFALCISTITAS
jgi:hypothetical protein